MLPLPAPGAEYDVQAGSKGEAARQVCRRVPPERVTNDAHRRPRRARRAGTRGKVGGGDGEGKGRGVGRLEVR
eukprot:scaffold7603_cov59-Phaeocystis_antarctica.AAC.3